MQVKSRKDAASLLLGALSHNLFPRTRPHNLQATPSGSWCEIEMELKLLSRRTAVSISLMYATLMIPEARLRLVSAVTVTVTVTVTEC